MFVFSTKMDVFYSYFRCVSFAINETNVNRVAPRALAY